MSDSIGDMLRDAQKKRVEDEEKAKQLGKQDTKVPCVTSGCPSTITQERIERTIERNPMHMMIGGQNPTEIISTLYCEHCGVRYHILPKLRREGGKKF